LIKVISYGKKGKSICGIITFLLNISENRFFLKSFYWQEIKGARRCKSFENKKLQFFSFFEVRSSEF